ncbi:hypothetical protein COW36_08255 [bacterium (Candidatus Blackallbacteria) CG17_big_fil_post_rev_8_21_14_2_50_48_46]|uniref:Phosphatidylglycerol lysyltransferase C-terminal domain-containing protein n=1 Tax=bacterium (Candidatus Blackallbacteria) CG17_big_fil_post_rev_8_21_14_2_50_48_46 TaxID=2014261 RepID=A0A2M7G659_9BACT|nr:MAG: hypothetical protein COW64_24795 [bacterium (Candidatus Blackallbacteria) CG18_big_fil_WC_8_21_14_2_50_49_26]PIW17482.1 MAG: hypothetical protein COW36_08255 [bacterium (Candidatus Blackallbacteria) CG17_big_fil_post_rev_8_21_14_2_50_48_46]PIW48336.1 MAG: hypothetical protein COW20_09610 [bacterium (Candidatus Blackallbacteria) CG13_big_fil_rev_8_21_14_2_50_49_14]
MQAGQVLNRLAPEYAWPPDALEAEPLLPLSWSWGQRNEAQFKTVQLFFSRRTWIPFADLPPWETMHALTHSLHTYGQNGFVIRGCPPGLEHQLLQRGGQSLISGREALLDLQGAHFQKRSLKDLIRRGRRHGIPYEVLTPAQYQDKRLKDFIQSISQNYPTTLRFLYLRELEQAQRVFVFESNKGQILGLVSLSRSGRQSWHAELMLRHPQAPIGLMESLISEIFIKLRHEGYLWWSLGEVPFYPLAKPQGLKEQLLHQAGRSLEPVFSAEGLYRFKAKFRPFWRPVLLYGYPDLNWRVLWDMFQLSQCAQLAWQAWMPTFFT